MSESRCHGTNKRGESCGARPIKGRPWCLKHDPGLENQRREWNREGGHRSSNASRAAKRIPADIRAVLDDLYETLAELRSGTLPKGRATEVAAVAGAIVRVYEVASVESRLDRIETLLEEEAR